MAISMMDYLALSTRWTETAFQIQPLMERFASCVGDVERFVFAEDLVKNILGFSTKPRVSFRGKDPKKAEAARKRGNKLFSSGDLPGALAAYNESILCASWKDDGVEDKTCLVLSFGNRSAVFFRMKRFGECVDDIDRAVMLGYPQDSVKKLLMRKANAFLAVAGYSQAVYTLRAEGRALGIVDPDIHSKAQFGAGMEEYANLLNDALQKMHQNGSTAQSQRKILANKYPNGLEMIDRVKKFSLKDGPNRTFTSASSLITMKYNDRAGRHIVAAEEIRPGAVLLIEPAFVSVLVNSAITTNCYSCHVWTDSPFPCRFCSVAVFCSSYCAAGPKAALHTRECRFMYTFYDDFGPGVLGAGPHIVMAVRTVLMKTPKEWRHFMTSHPGNLKGEADEFSGILGKKYLSNDYANVFCLSKNLKNRDIRFVLDASLVSVYLMRILDETYFSDTKVSKDLRNFIGGILLRHIFSYSICYFIATEVPCPLDERLPAVDAAAVVHPTFELFNDACYSNTTSVHYGDTLVLRARRVIRKGESLTRAVKINFVDVNREKRREFLRTVPYECECRACVENWPVAGVLIQKHAEMDVILKCPFCSAIWGRTSGVVKPNGPIFTGCPKCKATADQLRPFVRDFFEPLGVYDLGNPDALMADADNRFERISNMSRIGVDPCWRLHEAAYRADISVWLGGNRRYGNPPKDQMWWGTGTTGPI